MNYKFLFTTILILAVITTICICTIKPQMHSAVLVFDSKYKIVEQKVETEIEKEIPTVSQEQKSENIQTKIENTVIKQPQTTKTNQIKHTQNNPQSNNIQKKEEQKQIKTLTATQEDIEWNIWRSNIQNQLMKDVKLPIIPQGTVFKFEFDVDKYGKVSNVQTFSLTPAYTPYAIQYIAPVIRSYQGRAILNFPDGTQRTSTHVIGGWKIATEVKYSTPKDYNDTETVKKVR